MNLFPIPLANQCPHHSFIHHTNPLFHRINPFLSYQSFTHHTNPLFRHINPFFYYITTIPFYPTNTPFHHINPLFITLIYLYMNPLFHHIYTSFTKLIPFDNINPLFHHINTSFTKLIHFDHINPLFLHINPLFITAIPISSHLILLSSHGSIPTNILLLFPPHDLTFVTTKSSSLAIRPLESHSCRTSPISTSFS